MLPAADAHLQQIEEKIAAIHAALSVMQYLSSGTLLKRTKVCGNPRCHCANNPAARHGPCYEWSYLQAGKLRHRTLTPRQAELMHLAIANHRKVKKLLKAWEVQTRRLIDANAREEPFRSRLHRRKLPGNSPTDVRKVRSEASSEPPNGQSFNRE